MTPLWQFPYYLRYNLLTGEFVWLNPTSHRVKIGDVAGSKMANGYINIRLFQTQVLAHRLAWAFVYGHFPNKHIDHINGNRSDNRIANLRESNRSQNGQNAFKPRHGITSTHKGVDWDKDKKKWRVQICHNKQRIFVGRFDSEEVAASTYDWMAVRLFGEYAKPNGEVITL